MKQLEIDTKQANLALTNVQTKNAMQDNTRQLLVAMIKQAGMGKDRDRCR